MKPNCCQNKKLEDNLKEIKELLKVLAEENRLKILCILKKEKKCVCEIWQVLELRQNLVSHHLKILKQAKLIEEEKRGLKIYYSINKKEVDKFNSLLNKFLKKYE